MRRQEGLILVVLSQLRAGADWGRIAREYAFGDPPSTELGMAEAAFWTRGPRPLTRGRSKAALDPAIHVCLNLGGG